MLLACSPWFAWPPALQHQPEPRSPGLFVHPHPVMHLEGMLNVLNHPELCLVAGYKAKFLPKTRAVNPLYFEGIIPSRWTLPGQGSGCVGVELVHKT